MSSIANPFVSAGIPTLLKHYLNLTNADILKEKDSYWLTYNLIKVLKEQRDLNENKPTALSGMAENSTFTRKVVGHVSLYRYLCAIFREPSFVLQTAMDSYYKTQELLSAASSSNNRRQSHPLPTNVNYGRQFLEYLADSEDYGIQIEILPPDAILRPHGLCSLERDGGNNMSMIPFKITNTNIDWVYSWQTSTYNATGACANSPFQNLDGTYVLLTFPQSGKAQKPFYSDYLFLKVKQKHINWKYPVSENGSTITHNRVMQPEVGSAAVDIYATLPEDYDTAKNSQMVLGTRCEATGTWQPVNLAGGYYYSWQKRHTFMRWSRAITTEDRDPKWKFKGIYYGDHYNGQIQNIPDLDDFAFSEDQEDLGRGKIFIDKDKILYCPLTGVPLRVCSPVSNSCNKYSRPARDKAYW